MRARSISLVALTIAGCAVALGQANFVWDYPTTSYPPPTFTANGDTTFMSSAGGSQIYAATVSGANANDYEMRTVLSTTLNLAGGTYVHFLRATSNAVASAGSCAGSYISVEFALPSGWLNGGSAAITVNQCVSGTHTVLASASAPIHNGDTLRSVAWGAQVLVLVNNASYGRYAIPLTTGQPGYGGHNNPAANLAAPWVGHHDVISPSPVQPQTIQSSVLPTSVSLRWQAVADDPVGIGVWKYSVDRNGVLMGNVPEPAFTDTTVLPSTTYTYTILTVDFHLNSTTSTPTTFTITTPPATAIDPRRTGIYTTGSYWGGGGEQIDTLSGNLNFSLPLLTAVGRAGSNIPVGLVYNSQNWRQDNGVNWNLGYDVGFGYGWQLLIGSITPYNTNLVGGVDHYVYTDSTGAQYVLNVNTSGVWSSTQSTYVWFDSNADKLHFRDGSFWVMGSMSGGTEADAGTLYPTIIEDVSGNQVIVTYDSGVGLPSTATNSSARITRIEDSRAAYDYWYGTSAWWTYIFHYTGTPVPHLASINNIVGTSEVYTLTYSGSVALGPPFGTDPTYAGLTTAHLSTVTTPTAGPWQFSYDTAGAGELLQATFPWGGHLRWTYGIDPYSGSRDLRAVTGRYLAADSAGATEWSYTISRDNAAASGAITHGTMSLSDASGVGAKTWNFSNTTASPAWQIGLASEFVQSAVAGGTVLQDDLYTWSQDPAGNPYISTKASTIGQGTLNVETATSTQTLDQYGNVTASVIYPYNNTTTPLKTFNNTYLSTSTYTSKYIYNRLVSSIMTPATGPAVTLVTNTYDSSTNCSGSVGSSTPCSGWVAPASGPTREIDPSPPIPVGQRGYLNYSVTPAKSTTLALYTYGSAAMQWGSDGSISSASADASTNFNAPVTITSQSYMTTLAYNSWLGVTQTNGANGEQMSMTYDSYGRPATATSPYCGSGCYSPTVSYSYGTSAPFTQTKTGPDGVTTTTLDGLGRPILVSRGDTASMHSSTATVYAPCACSPLAKIQKTSQPYVYGSSATAWTTYSYDGLGRPVTVVQPDSSSTTRYFYSGNVTTVGDPTALPAPPAPPTGTYTGGVWK